jgi:excinuclease ABC subunit C
MMDGGKGQVNVALEVLDKLNIHIPVCGMVKDDYHRTRGLYFNNEEIEFPKNSQAFDMITRLQDEAHRFAINYHKSLRSKAQIHSVLDDIPGIGATRRKNLMSVFKDIDKIKQSEIDELAQVPAMNRRSAEEVYNFFHNK